MPGMAEYYYVGNNSEFRCSRWLMAHWQAIGELLKLNWTPALHSIYKTFTKQIQKGSQCRKSQDIISHYM